MSHDWVQRASKEREDRIKSGMEEKRRGGMPGERPVKEPSFIASICRRHSAEIAVKKRWMLVYCSFFFFLFLFVVSYFLRSGNTVNELKEVLKC